VTSEWIAMMQSRQKKRVVEACKLWDALAHFLQYIDADDADRAERDMLLDLMQRVETNLALLILYYTWRKLIL